MRAGDGHSSRTPVARRLERPTRKSVNGPDRSVTRVRKRTSRLLPVWPCTRWGLPSQAGHPACWCALTAPFHPYRTRRKRRARRSILCGTFPSLAAGGRYPPPCPAVPGLSSRRIEIRPATIQPAPGHYPFYHIGPATTAPTIRIIIQCELAHRSKRGQGARRLGEAADRDAQERGGPLAGEDGDL